MLKQTFYGRKRKIINNGNIYNTKLEKRKKDHKHFNCEFKY